MLAGLKRFFFREVDWPVEAYGKLPCYKDYISVITSVGAAQWRTWLLESFQGKGMPPDGVWPFIYWYRKNADLVIGLIQASSDGLREFPFTLFVVCGRGARKRGVCSRPMALSIWRELESIRQQVVKARDVQECYARIYGKRVSFVAESTNLSEGIDHVFSCNPEGNWPQMLVLEMRDAGMLQSQDAL